MTEEGILGARVRDCDLGCRGGGVGQSCFVDDGPLTVPVGKTLDAFLSGPSFKTIAVCMRDRDRR